jgi:hypothetical protein
MTDVAGYTYDTTLPSSPVRGGDVDLLLATAPRRWAAQTTSPRISRW